LSLKGKLRVYELPGGTQVVRVWRDLQLSEVVTGAASRLMLVDTQGEIPSDVLCEWLGKAEAERKDWEESRDVVSSHSRS